MLATTISAADPVDQLTGRLVELPHSPFLTGELAPAEVLADLLPEPPTVDNDVNWAAVAEHRLGVATDLSEFVYCYLGAGLGLGLVSGGRVLHGHRGLAGELAHVPTSGPGGRTLRLVQCFAEWGLQRPGTAAIDVPALTRLLDGDGEADRGRRDEIVQAVGMALSGVAALLNPQVLVLGGPWGGSGGYRPGWPRCWPTPRSRPRSGRPRSATTHPSSEPASPPSTRPGPACPTLVERVSRLLRTRLRTHGYRTAGPGRLQHGVDHLQGPEAVAAAADRFRLAPDHRGEVVDLVGQRVAALQLDRRLLERLPPGPGRRRRP